MAEARRLWDLEVGRNKLTTIQAAAVMSLRHIADGTDKIGLSYIVQAVTMAEHMSLFTSNENEDTKSDIARAVTAWSLFSWQRFVGHISALTFTDYNCSMCCFYMRRPPLIKNPPIVPLLSYESAHIWTGDINVEYPLAQTLTPIYLGLS